MASKVAPTISGPGSIKMPTKGGRNATTNESTRAAGQVAPVPKGGAPIAGNDRPGAGVQAGMARVANVGNGPNQGSMPLRKPPGGLANTRIGQQNPQTGAVATVKPKRKGLGSAFFGEY